MRPDFLDDRPYAFQLQVGVTDNQDADDWVDVGAEIEDTFYAVDGEQRYYGKSKWQFYRVRLTTTAGIYYSDPTGLCGTLDQRWWRVAANAMRQHLVAMRVGPGGQLGYLLKARQTGTLCPRCLDHQSKQVRDPDCPICFGTGYLCGYYFPIGCVYASLNPKVRRTVQDPMRGTVQDFVAPAEMVNVWSLEENDVWVNKKTDDRYFVYSIQHISEVKGVPIAANVELRLAPATDRIYSLVIPHQLDAIEPMMKTVGW